MKSLFTYLFISALLFLSGTTQVYSQKKLVATYSEQLNNGSFQAYDSVHLEYDGNNRQTAWWSSYYDRTTSTWKKLLRYEYSYNPSGDISNILVKIWSNNAWVANNLDTYIYENNFLKTVNQTRWYNNQWNNASKTEYFYNSANNIDSTLYYNYSNNTFNKNTKNIFSYNVDDNVTEDLQFSWDENLASWIISHRSRYIYNTKKLNTRTIIEQKAQFGWNILREELMTYDSDNDIRTSNRRDNNGVVTSKRIYIYDAPATSISEISSLNVKAYPNPANNYINFDLNEDTPYKITITDITGKTIKSSTIHNTTTPSINISDLKEGLYFYRLQNSLQQNTSGKFIVNH